VNAFPTYWHQLLCDRLCQQLRPQLPAAQVAAMGIGWKPGSDEFGPDVIVFRLADHQVRAPRFTGLPLLVAEVLSQDVSRDTVVKAHRYAKAGLQQYWLVNPEGVVDVLALASAERGLYRVEQRISVVPRIGHLAGRHGRTDRPGSSVRGLTRKS
jgi:Uma2 family endonuclease